jgi:hypothetical protein
MQGFLLNFQNKIENVNNDALKHKLSESESAMNEQAKATLAKVQQAVGLR